LSILLHKPDYPIYAVDVFTSKNGGNSTIALGGGREGGFLGIPVHLYDVQEDN